MKRVGNLYLKSRVEIATVLEVVDLFEAFKAEKSSRLKYNILKDVIGRLAAPVPSLLDWLPWRKDNQGKLKIRLSHVRHINDVLFENGLLNGKKDKGKPSTFSKRDFMRSLITLAVDVGGQTGISLARGLTQNEFVFMLYANKLKKLMAAATAFKAAQDYDFGKELNAEFKKLQKALARIDGGKEAEKEAELLSPDDQEPRLVTDDYKSRTDFIAAHILEPC